MERTFIIIKPDAVKRGLFGKIMATFEDRGFKILKLDMEFANKETIEEHYKHLSEVPVFAQIVGGMLDGPIIKAVLEGKNAVSVVKTMVGATDPSKADLGSIRGKYAVDIGKNICHASDSVENANIEMKLWYPDTVIESWTNPTDSLVVRY